METSVHGSNNTMQYEQNCSHPREMKDRLKSIQYLEQPGTSKPQNDQLMDRGKALTIDKSPPETVNKEIKEIFL